MCRCHCFVNFSLNYIFLTLIIYFLFACALTSFYCAGHRLDFSTVRAHKEAARGGKGG